MGAANRAKRVGGNRRLKIGRNPSTSASTPPFANERVSNRIELLPPFEVGRAKSVSPIGPIGQFNKRFRSRFQRVNKLPSDSPADSILGWNICALSYPRLRKMVRLSNRWIFSSLLSAILYFKEGGKWNFFWKLEGGRKEMIKTVCQFSIFRVFSDLISFVNFSSIARNL